MKKILWEQMKLKAQQEFSAKNFIGNAFPGHVMFYALLEACHIGFAKRPEQIAADWVEQAYKLIENWDIRKCMKLAELFPSCLPKHLHGLKPECDYDEKGNWALFFQYKTLDNQF